MVIDFHTHCFPDKISSRAIKNLEENIFKIQGENFPARNNGSLQGLKQNMQVDNIDYSVVLPIATTITQSGTINSYAKEINGKDGIISFGSVHPMQDDYDRVLEGICESGLKGIKLHPEYQGVYVNSPEVIRVLKKADELGLYVVLHSGRDIGMPEPVHCIPEHLNHVLDHVSGYKIIAAHMGAWQLWNDVEKHLVGTPIIFDTSYLKDFIDKEQLLRIIRNHGADKIVFGSDLPWMTAGESQSYLNSIGLTKQELDSIYYRNAVKMLDIDLNNTQI